MMDTLWGGVVMFGVLFAICMIGMVNANNHSSRLRAAGQSSNTGDQSMPSGQPATAMR